MCAWWGIPKGYFVVKKTVLNVGIKAYLRITNDLKKPDFEFINNFIKKYINKDQHKLCNIDFFKSRKKLLLTPFY